VGIAGGLEAGFFPGIPNGGVNTPIADEKHPQGSEAETPPLGVRVSNSGTSIL